jgi:hypothetical protein
MKLATKMDPVIEQIEKAC